MALVVPSFYMDTPKANTRHIINNEGVIIDVVRLPDNLFEQATVTVDIIFIRRSGNKVHNILETTTLQQGDAHDNINKYWIKNPKRILGQLQLKWVEKYKRYVPSCITENREQSLRYLTICEFTQMTIENYQKIVEKPAITGEELTGIVTQMEILLNRINQRFNEQQELIKQQAADVFQLADLQRKAYA